MKIEVDENRGIVLKEVFNGVLLESRDKEQFGICMRDTGFEFEYNGISYEAKNGILKEMSSHNATNDSDKTKTYNNGKSN